MVFEGELDSRVAELKALAKARTATEFAELAPIWLAPHPTEGNDAVAALTAAIASMPDPVFRAAALALFPLPYDTSPGSLSERRQRAAQQFNVGASTFRTPTSIRASYEEQVLGAVLAQLDSTTPEPPDRPRRPRLVGRTRTVALGSLAVLAALALIAGLAALRRDEPPAPARGEAAPAPELPDAPMLRPGPEETVEFTPGPASASDEADQAVTVCPTANVDLAPGSIARVGATLEAIDRPGRLCQSRSPAEHWDMTVVLIKEYGRRETWMDVGYPDGRHLVVPNEAWEGYLTLRNERGGDQTGRPATWTLRSDGSSTLQTDGGDLVIGVASAFPHFYMIEPFVSTWNDRRGELGLPMSSSSADWVGFEHGRMSLNAGSVVVTVASPEQARRVLPAPDRLHNSVVRQRDGTSWFIDARGRRWWIPDGPTFVCLDGENQASLDQAPGAAVATLPPAGLATCDFATLY